MNCPNCKNKKGQPVQVHPVSHQCSKCKVRIDVDHTGKVVIRGSRKPLEKPSAPSKDQ